MSAIRLYLDEDIHGATVAALTSRGIDAVSARHMGRLGDSDESQLDFATSQGRAFVTFNIAHFVVLHGDWIAQGRHHAGIVVSTQRPIGNILRGLANLVSQLSAEEMADRLEYLNNW